jgi:hypothetical protein
MEKGSCLLVGRDVEDYLHFALSFVPGDKLGRGHPLYGRYERVGYHHMQSSQTLFPSHSMHMKIQHSPLSVRAPTAALLLTGYLWRLYSGNGRKHSGVITNLGS